MLASITLLSQDGHELEPMLESVASGDWLEAASVPVYAGLRRGIPSLTRHLREGDRRVAAQLESVWGPADRVYRAACYLGYELGSTVTQQSDGLSLKLQVIAGLHGRALRTAAEIRLLALNGLGAGAVARQRSLHELAVVALVVQEANESVAERYLARAAVERWDDLRRYQEHHQALGRDSFDPEEIDVARSEAAAVESKFGPDLRYDNGWAKPLFPNHPEKCRVTFRDLEELAGLAHLRPFYGLGSHHVHAGPRAAELNTSQDANGAVRITTGATVFADVAETSHGAMISLLQITSALVVEGLVADLEAAAEVSIGLQCLSRLVADGGERYHSAAQRARDLGWIDHEIAGQ